MAGARTKKRLHVRLKAVDREGLAGTFGPCVHESGVFVASSKLLPVDTPVSVTLCYADGQVALAGEGHVVGVRSPNRPPSGMKLKVTWNQSSRELLRWILERAKHLASRNADEISVESPNLEALEAAMNGKQGSIEFAKAAAADLTLPRTSSSMPASIENAGPNAEPPMPSSDEDVPILPAEESDEVPTRSSSWSQLRSFDVPVELDVDESSGEYGPLVTPILDASEAPTADVRSGSKPDQSLPKAQSTEYSMAGSNADDLTTAAVEAPGLWDESDGWDRESGEVTPLARIQLVRHKQSPIDWADAQSAGNPLVSPSAIPSSQDSTDLEEKSRRIIGVDLGHALTRAAILERGKPKLIHSRRGAPAIPSVVMIEPSGKTIVGEPALRKLPWRPEFGLSGTKRLLGRLSVSPWVSHLTDELTCSLGNGEQSEVAMRAGDQLVTLEEVTALILKEVRNAGNLALSERVNRGVFTCPASFGTRQRESLILAAHLAGFHVERVLSSPLAAALGLIRAQGMQPARWLVYDLGAGIFDAGIVEVDTRGARLLAGAGDPSVGGIDFDRSISEHMLNHVLKSDDYTPTSIGERRGILEAAEVGKWALSEEPITRVYIERQTDDNQKQMLEVELRRDDVARWMAPALDRTIEVCMELCRQSSVALSELDGVVLLGGQSKSPFVRQRVQEAFGDRIIKADPRETAVFGAAWMALELELSDPYPLQDVLPYTIGVGVGQGEVAPILRRGTPMPTSGMHTLQIRQPQDLEVFVFEGETQDVDQDEPIARLTIEDPGVIPATLELTIQVDESGTVTYDAREASTGARLDVGQRGSINRELLRARLGQRERPARQSSTSSRLISKLVDRFR